MNRRREKRSNSKASTRSNSPSPIRRARPSFEALEDRLTPFVSPFELSTLLPPLGNGSEGFAIGNSGASLGLDYQFQSAGDINGDGYDDIVIGTPRITLSGEPAGKVYVVFGKATGYAADLDLSSLNGSNGFVINEANLGDLNLSSVNSAGDVNGDGYDDIVIGAPKASAFGGTQFGAVYVVFGKSGGYTPSLNLATLDGTNGFKISTSGPLLEPGFEYTVNSVGDINGDGYDEIVVSRRIGVPILGAFFGESFVVFGKASGYNSVMTLSLDGSDGFLLQGIDFSSKPSFDSAGDINGDGFDEIIVGEPMLTGFGSTSTGRSYLIFGKATGYTGTLDVSILNGSNGFRINGIDPGDLTGSSVSSAGDINADGFDDIIIGAPQADPGGRSDAGRSYVVFGKAGGYAASFNLSTLDGTSGFAINGISAGDFAGFALNSAGDINADGYDDIIIAAPYADPGGRADTGQGYVLFGKASGFAAVLELASLNGTSGLTINGINPFNRLGIAGVSAADINGDGADDLILGINAFSGDFRRSFVLFGDVGFDAVPGGPYFLAEKESLVLNGSASVPGTYSYSWDLNGDGFFTDVTGPTPTIDWFTLELLGLIDGPGSITQARLKVTAVGGASAISDPFTITATNAPPTLQPFATLNTSVRGQVLIFPNADDSLADKLAGIFYEVDWNNDGTFDETMTSNDSLAYFSRSYSTMGTKTIRLRATDKESGVSPIVTYSFDVRPAFFQPSMFSDSVVWLGSGGDDDVAFSYINNNTIRITESKIAGVVVNNVFDVTTGPLDIRPTYLRAYGFAGNDRIDLSGLVAPFAGSYAYGDNGDDMIIGSPLVDQIFGGAGNDTIYGGYNADWIDGGDDNDTIFGEMPTTPSLTPAQASIGADTIYGGLGNDLIYGDSDGGEGKADTIFGDDGTGSQLNGGNDTIHGDGSQGSQVGNDTIDGEAGDDVIHGDMSGAEGAADSLYGGLGNDFINTGGGNDEAFGGQGGDILLGGDGAEGASDTLVGGVGQDILVGDGGLGTPKSKAGGADRFDELTYEVDLIMTGSALPTQANPIDWFMIQAEWLRTDITTEEKLSHLQGAPGGSNGNNFLGLGVNVFDDVAVGGSPIVDTVNLYSPNLPSLKKVVISNQSQDIVNEPFEDLPLQIDLALYPRPA